LGFGRKDGADRFFVIARAASDQRVDAIEVDRSSALLEEIESYCASTSNSNPDG
jgi:hypothetical protein